MSIRTIELQDELNFIAQQKAKLLAQLNKLFDRELDIGTELAEIKVKAAEEETVSF